jgi:peptide/nickel transport system substrate-binding protein
MWSSFFERFRNLLRFKRGSASRPNSPMSLAVSQVLQAKAVSRIPRMDQIRQFPRLLNITERRIAGIAALVFIVSTLGAGWTLFNSKRITIPVNGGSFTEGLIGTPQLINPLYASANDVDSDLVKLLFSGLMKYDNEGNLVTDLASSYSISDDHKEYVFVLRENATWHDGEQIRVADVIFTVSAIQNAAYRSPLQSVFADVNAIQVDDRTVKFTLSEPFAPFLSLLTVGILPSHVWDEIQPINAVAAEPNRTPVGSGPYKLKTITRDGKGNIRSFLLVAYGGYYAKKPYIQQITLKFYNDLDSGLEAIKNKNVDGLAYVPLLEADQIDKISGVAIQKPYLQQYSALYFNSSKQGLYKDSSMRKALNIGVDRNRLVDSALRGLGRPILDPILEGVPGHQDPDLSLYNQDAARQLLSDLGWNTPEGESIRKKGDDPLHLILTTIDTPELIAVAEELQRQYKEIGIDLAINPVSPVAFQNDILPSRDYEMLLTGALLGGDPDMYSFWHSSQAREPGLNLAQFVNRKADEAIDKARATTDSTVRAESYTALATLLREEVPAVFLYQPIYPYALSQKIQGFNLSHLSLPDQRFSTITDWYIKTRRVLRSNAQ